MLRKITIALILVGIMMVPAIAQDSSDCDKKCDDATKVACNEQKAVPFYEQKSMDKSHHEKAKKKPKIDGAIWKLIDSGNPLDAGARTFVENDVTRIAILPFSDYSTISPIPSQSAVYWASRRIHDFMSAEFIKLGKVVVPYDTMLAAVYEIRGTGDIAPSGQALLNSQLQGFGFSSESTKYFSDTAMQTSSNYMESTVISMDLSAAEIITIGKALNVDAVFMGSISDYGLESYIKPDLRTFLPPFLGVINPTQRSSCRMLVYMYETKTGQLIWASMEEVDYEPFFPLFSTSNMKFDKLNSQLAENIVNHFRRIYVLVKPANVYDQNSPFGGPGTTRREKDFRELTK